MPVTIAWSDVALRLVLTVVAGTLIGINRTEHGRPAGLRTTLLVCLAASISMIQANLLMNTIGKTHDSFVVLDLMRLPLGILTGVGFIGAGAILRRENRVLGVTTAATMWFVTVIGLCFGGGQIGLGITATVIGVVVLWGLKRLEGWLPQDRQGMLLLTVSDGVGNEDIRSRITRANFQIVTFGIIHDNEAGSRQLSCEVRWCVRADESREPSFVRELAELPGVSKVNWQPQGAPAGAA
jgi:putative Mg2+ transporter-C (MgtC) family protein